MDDPLFPHPSAEASFVAIGDSFTEGLNDTAPGGGFRGWADRLAALLAADYPGFRYANLAVRGKLLREIVAEQVPPAAALAPGLVSLGGGGNDILRPGSDADTLAELFDAAVARLQGSGSRVLIFTLCDPGTFPVFRLLRGKIAAYNMNLRAIADARDCYLVDLWSMRSLRVPSAWSADRLHLTAESHQRIALRCAEVLGVPVTAARVNSAPVSSVPVSSVPVSSVPVSSVPVSSVPVSSVPVTPAPLTPAPVTPAAWLAARRADARWAREYLAPWVNRRLHGTSSGHGRDPKRPALEVFAPPVTS
jgi:lysophospholipase L1-like esterase